MTDAIIEEALAEVWASLDGKLEDFRAGKTAPNIEDFGGHYEGYLSDAGEMIRRLEARGYAIVSVLP